MTTIEVYQAHCKYPHCSLRFEGKTIPEAVRKVEEHEKVCPKRPKTAPKRPK